MSNENRGEQDARPNDEERDWPDCPSRPRLARSSSSVSFTFGDLRVRKALRWLLFTSVGAIVGTGFGLLANYGLVRLCVALSPNDPSAASVGIMVIALVPLGFFGGAAVGAARSRRTDE
jgi:hypothetical protein